MDFLDVSLILSILSCTLVTGFILTYAVVVMPGLSKLDDKEFLRAFQVTDGVIQNNQPLFILTWLGSVISVVAAILSSIIIVGLPDGLKVGSYFMCSGCRKPISPKDKKSKKYEEGVSCPNCHDNLTDAQKARFRMRQKQINLAKKSRSKHIFQKEFK